MKSLLALVPARGFPNPQHAALAERVRTSLSSGLLQPLRLWRAAFLFPLLAAAPLRAQPIITTQPSDQTNLSGRFVTFSVTATGTPPLTYEWRAYSSTNPVAFLPIRGATESSLRVGPLPFNTFPARRWFDAVVSDSSGSVTSRLAYVQVLTQDVNRIQFEMASYGVFESAGHVTLTVRRLNTPVSEIDGYDYSASVDFATVDDTAIAGRDYIATSGTITFLGGQTTYSISVPILNDGAVRGARVFRVLLSNPTRYFAELIPPTTAFVTIYEDDNGLFFGGFEPAREGAGAAVVHVRRGDDGTNTVTVDYATRDGTATAGLDYTATRGTLTFLAGERDKTFTVPILDDQWAENNEIIEIALTNPTGGGMLGNGGLTEITTGLAIIDDDDGLSFGRVDPVLENAGTAVIRVTRDDHGTNMVTVDYTTSDNSATAGLDYLPTRGTLTFVGGERSKTFTVPILNDRSVEGDETILIILTHPAGREVSAYLTIIDNDYGLNFGAVEPVPENAGAAVVHVTRGDDGTNTVTVDYATHDGTATAGLDYLSTRGTLTFVGGERDKMFTVPVLNDELVEGDETIRIALSHPTGGAVFQSGGLTGLTNILTLLDNDTGVQFSEARSIVREAGRVAVIRVRRGDDGPGTVTVNYATSDGTATAEQDYTATRGTLTFGPGEMEKSFTIPILDDALPEGAETLRLSLSGLTGPAVFGANSNALLTLLDDERSSTPVTRARPVIAAGRSHTLALKADGSLWAWGFNAYGQLGTGMEYNETNVPSPVGTDHDWTTVAVGTIHTIAIKFDGSLWAWGHHGSGQLGVGSNFAECTNVPVQVGGDHDWSMVAAEDYFSFGLKTDGSLWSWGWWRGLVTNRPTRLGTDSNWTWVATSWQRTLAVKQDGSLWELNANGATSVGSDRDWDLVAVAAGQGFWPSNSVAIALKDDGSLWSWGENFYGQLGDGTRNFRNEPGPVGTDHDWAAIATGARHTLALKRDGTLWGWGANGYRQLGDGTRDLRLEPTPIGSVSDWVAVEGGGDRTVAIKSDGSLWQWGEGSSFVSAAPRRIATGISWSDIAAGGNQSLAIQTNGHLWVWGNLQAVPTPIVGTEVVRSVAAGSFHSLIVGIDGSLWAHNFFQNPTNLTRIGADNDWRMVAAGAGHSIALKTDGSLWGWGLDNAGQSGTRNGFPTNTPQRIGLANDWRVIAAGSEHTLGIKTDGSLWGWGLNSLGQLGIDTIDTFTSSPVRIGSGNDWRAVAAGPAHTVALKMDGSLWAWGYSGPAGRSSPVRIGNDRDWTTIACGGYYTLALKADGSLWAWGGNSAGQLGLGSPSLVRDFPSRVGVDNDWIKIAAGGQHSLALKADGSLWAWGHNGDGQVGDGTGWTPTRFGTNSDWAQPVSSPVRGEFRITTQSVNVDHSRTLFFTHTNWQAYYVLYRGDALTNITTPVDAALARAYPSLTDRTPPSTDATAFYRIRAVPRAQPLDLDHDGIDDDYELRHPAFLNPLNPADAAQHHDGDGKSNLSEYRADTDRTSDLRSPP